MVDEIFIIYQLPDLWAIENTSFDFLTTQFWKHFYNVFETFAIFVKSCISLTRAATKNLRVDLKSAHPN